ncbi:alpha-(1,3)-fucosyltransferase 7 [Corythoichthys intestinalis]|uniref:alpha-(1,3)-fucosyltransferase 7 n=1 Tax=Corythoichthys intestinalis TaxID=161448 RepID=UPI0025A650DE|nr:alpha-(1,3)-fucosyltransferase 7 [Corythoichthys intestinalis]XP_057675645.1 alpha-(1,3)-fucosyltransferase 7 [Corythoichthys intestinalis]
MAMLFDLLNCNRTKRISFMKKCLLLFLLCVLPLAFLKLQHTEIIVDTKQHNSVTILLWHRPFGASYDMSGDPCLGLHNNTPLCKVTEDKSLFPKADVVVFHNSEIARGQVKLPLNRPRPLGQRWAWLSLESPANNGDLRKFANIFNLTMNYRRDADITTNYGERVEKVTSEDAHPVQNVTRNKEFLACWVVSNYNPSHRRSKVYKELNNIIPVKVFGRWTKTPLSTEALLPTISRCYFYLAFENSEFKDYITEKLWKNAYLSGAVPVVLGAPVQDYEAVAPPHSFIHVDQFKSVKMLAEYLLQVAGDQKRYNEYFQWKQKWNVKVRYNWIDSLCKLCSHYDHLPPNKVYSDLAAWHRAK